MKIFCHSDSTVVKLIRDLVRQRLGLPLDGSPLPEELGVAILNDWGRTNQLVQDLPDTEPVLLVVNRGRDDNRLAADRLREIRKKGAPVVTVVFTSMSVTMCHNDYDFKLASGIRGYQCASKLPGSLDKVVDLLLGEVPKGDDPATLERWGKKHQLEYFERYVPPKHQGGHHYDPEWAGL